MDWFVEKFVLKKYVKESGLSSFMENYMDIDFMSLLIFYSLNDLYIDMLFFLSFQKKRLDFFLVCGCQLEEVGRNEFIMKLNEIFDKYENGKNKLFERDVVLIFVENRFVLVDKENRLLVFGDFIIVIKQLEIMQENVDDNLKNKEFICSYFLGKYNFDKLKFVFKNMFMLIDDEIYLKEDIIDILVSFEDIV